MASYKGVTIKAGTDAQIAAQVAAIDAQSSPTPTTTPVTNASTSTDPNAPNIVLSSTMHNADGTVPGGVTKTQNFKGSTPIGPSTTSPYVPDPPLSAAQSAALAKQYGLTGIAKDDAFVGLGATDAAIKAKSIRDGLAANTSQNTSYTYNPATLTGAKKTLDKFNLNMKDATSNTWNSAGTKDTLKKGIYESTANEYGKLFDTTSDFDSLYNSNADFKNNIDAFVKAGGDVNAIKQRIQANGVSPSTIQTSRIQAVQGLMQQGVTDPAQALDYLNHDNNGNVTGDFTLDEVNSIMSGKNNVQSTADYLSTPTNLQGSDKAALDSLIPERQLAQDEIIRQANIPQQYQDLYFGTPEQVGVLQEKRVQAEEKVRILKTKAQNDENDLNAQASLAIDQNDAQTAADEATIEENRLKARNYTTGMLAKLGALNTTGAAVEGLANLEQKYQAQAQKTKTDAAFKTRDINIKLKKAINDVETDRDNDILTVQSDLTKDKETVLKEVLKLRQDSDKTIYSITDKAANELRTQREKYGKEAKALADKNAKEYAKLAGTYDVNGVKIPTAKEKAAALNTDVQNAVKQLRTIVKTQNFAGVSQDDYDTFEQYFIDTYGTSGVSKLKAAMKELGLEVDTVGDGKGGI